MQDVSFVAGLIGLITLIVFFVMAAALGNISKNLKDIKKILVTWGNENGYGVDYMCSKCKKHYIGRYAKCPHCGDEKTY
jgi:hypothetical protein